MNSNNISSDPSIVQPEDKNKPKLRTYKRRRISDKDIYELRPDSLMECIDVISNGNIIKHIAVTVFESVGKFGIDGRLTIEMISEYLASHMVPSEKEKLFGKDVFLDTKDAFMAYFSICPGYSRTIIGDAAYKYVTDKYEIIGGKPVRRKLIKI